MNDTLTSKVALFELVFAEAGDAPVDERELPPSVSPGTFQASRRPTTTEPVSYATPGAT